MSPRDIPENTADDTAVHRNRLDQHEAALSVSSCSMGGSNCNYERSAIVLESFIAGDPRTAAQKLLSQTRFDLPGERTFV